MFREVPGFAAVIMTDKVDPSKTVNTSSVTEEISNEGDKEPLSFQLPLPHLHPSAPSAVSPPSDQAYRQASIIFQRLREEKPVARQLLHYEKKTDTPLSESRDEPTERQAYELAFNTLKYQDLLENVITDSCFHTSQHISSDLLPLAMVMLFDFQDRRFLLHERSTKDGEEPIPEVRVLESSLHRSKTKLAASLARCRVKLNLQSVSCFLSVPVRTKHQRSKHLPLYAWVNTLKISVEEMCEALQRAGLSEGKNITDVKESVFCRDPLCPDTLVFSRHLHALLQHSSLTTTRLLNIQDRSLCVAVSVLRPLLFDHGDVLVVGFFSAVTVAHIAVVAAARSGRVLVCGADHTTLHVQDIQELLTEMDIKNVRVLSEAFCSLDEWNATIKHLKVIIVLPQCSSSALSDPVPTIHSEHGDWDLLPDLSHGAVSKRKIHTVATQQAKLLLHALHFTKVQTVVYCTRSVYPEENEQLVKRVLEKTHTHPKLLPFRVNGPIFPDDSQSDNTADKFFRLEPSQFTNGCFIARLSRQADPTKVETVHDVLARAAAKGLLGGIIPEQSKIDKKRKNRKNRSASSKPPSPSSEERQAGRELLTGQDPVTPLERRERGEGDFEGSEEGEEHTKEEGKGEKKEEKKRRHKRKLKRHAGQTPTVSKHHPKSHKKKLTKTKVSQSQPKKRQTKRRIPRLTLTLMSSGKPPKHLSPITAVAHKLIDSPEVKSHQAGVFITPSPAGKLLSPAQPAPPAPHVASKQGKRQNTLPESSDETIKDAAKPASLSERRGEVVRPEIKVDIQDVKATDFVLPPISSPSSGSLRSKSGSSSSQPQLSNTSASSSSIYLPGL